MDFGSIISPYAHHRLFCSVLEANGTPTTAKLFSPVTRTRAEKSRMSWQTAGPRASAFCVRRAVVARGNGDRVSRRFVGEIIASDTGRSPFVARWSIVSASSDPRGRLGFTRGFL